MDYLLQLFKGVASQTRLKILQYLADNKEHKIEDIAQTLKVPFATCCRNLKILERIYLIESKRK
ncbi:MAG: winged helix-turn-helix transcriptional regulator, partial [Thermodesulfobacterium sp.]|nr:winged helix-turn-helix transcriptional regulator [Thermodesulfobacterium sp.]